MTDDIVESLERYAMILLNRKLSGDRDFARLSNATENGIMEKLNEAAALIVSLREEFQLGDEVQVSESYKYYHDWRNDRLMIVGMEYERGPFDQFQRATKIASRQVWSS